MNRDRLSMKSFLAFTITTFTCLHLLKLPKGKILSAKSHVPKTVENANERLIDICKNSQKKDKSTFFSKTSSFKDNVRPPFHNDDNEDDKNDNECDNDDDKDDNDADEIFSSPGFFLGERFFCWNFKHLSSLQQLKHHIQVVLQTHPHFSSKISKNTLSFFNQYQT